MNETSDTPMPPHNLLRHATGYVSRGCGCCDWLLERGFVRIEDCSDYLAATEDQP